MRSRATPDSREAEKLARLVQKLREDVANLETRLRSLKVEERNEVADQLSNRLPIPPTRVRGRPLRALVLDTLEDLGWPAYSRELTLYCKARYGREIPPHRFGTLAKDEVDAYRAQDRGRARTRTLWLCFALTYNRHEAIKRLWARSDWPLERRIVGPLTGRVQHLKLTAKLCELALGAHDTVADPDMMRIIAADHARDLPGVVFKRGKFDLELWRDVALKILEQVESRDEEIRKESAERLKARPELYQLFGVPEGMEGSMATIETARSLR